MQYSDKNIISLLSLILILGFSISSFSINLLIWEPGPLYPVMVLPAPNGLTPTEIVYRYLHFLNNHSELRAYGSIPNFKIPIGKTTIVRDLSTVAKTSFGVFANHSEHLFLPKSGTEMQLEMRMVTEQLETRGAKVYVLPLIADRWLDSKLANEFRETLANSFDALLALGSMNAVHPYLFGELEIKSDPNLLNAENDLWRLDTIRKFNRAERGIFYGICWGHQMCGVSMGSKLIQNILEETNVKQNHFDTWHLIDIDPNSTLYKIIGRSRVAVNSYHFQAIKIDSSMPVDVVARSTGDSETVIEAIEFKNGLGITFQFHPEYMDTKAGRKILTSMVRYAALYKSIRAEESIKHQCLQSLLRSRL